MTTNRNSLCGPHVKWFPVTYQADVIAFESHSSFTYDKVEADDDYNIDLLRKDHALFTSGKDVLKQLYSEFDSPRSLFVWAPAATEVIKMIPIAKIIPIVRPILIGFLHFRG